jgi:hypothetical protein
MQEFRSLDALVRARLRRWPQRPPGAPARPGWLRGRPTEIDCANHPFLKLPGSNRLRTLPDGLWLHFGGTPAEPFVDILAIEACSTLPNLLDKRSRFAPSTQSLLAVCPVPWLLGPTAPGDATPRWRSTGVMREAPTQTFTLPVRDVRVFYALTRRNYRNLARCHVPHPHEYFLPMEALVAEDATDNPELCALFARASIAANFFGAT